MEEGDVLVAEPVKVADGTNQKSKGPIQTDGKERTGAYQCSI